MSGAFFATWQQLRRLALAAALLAILAPGWQPPVQANDEAPDWEPTLLTGNAQRLFMLTGGALFAQLGNDLYRSDDTGTSWSSISLPPPRVRETNPLLGPYHFARHITIDPTNHAVIYASGADGLHRSLNGGRTWDVVLPASSRVWLSSSTTSANVEVSGGSDIQRGGPTRPNIRIGGLTYDPTKPDTVYVALLSVGTPASLVRTGMGVRVSHDGGVTWTDLGQRDIGAVSDLALNADRKLLYAATNRGVFRMRLTP